MTGTIVRCLEEVVVAAGGEAAWAATLRGVGRDGDHLFVINEDVDDAEVVALIGSAAQALRVTPEQAMDAFGMHWSSVYAPRIYGVYFRRAKSLREFLLNMASVHEGVTRRMKSARPPRFEYDDSAPDALVMRYASDRHLGALMPGLIRGAAAYYGEEVRVARVGDTLTIAFRSAASRRAA